MGTRPRHRPERLGEKLLEIRNALGLSQSELLKRLEADEDLAFTASLEYESDKREPPLWLLLAYGARCGLSTSKTLSTTTWICPTNFPATSTTAASTQAPPRRR